MRMGHSKHRQVKRKAHRSKNRNGFPGRGEAFSKASRGKGGSTNEQGTATLADLSVLQSVRVRQPFYVRFCRFMKGILEAA